MKVTVGRMASETEVCEGCRGVPGVLYEIEIKSNVLPRTLTLCTACVDELGTAVATVALERRKTWKRERDAALVARRRRRVDDET